MVYRAWGDASAFDQLPLWDNSSLGSEAGMSHMPFEGKSVVNPHPK